MASGRFEATQLDDGVQLAAEVERLKPAEIILPDDPLLEQNLPEAVQNAQLVRYPAWHFDVDACRKRLTDHFGTQDLVAFGCEQLRPSLPLPVPFCITLAPCCKAT